MDTKINNSFKYNITSKQQLFLFCPTIIKLIVFSIAAFTISKKINVGYIAGTIFLVFIDFIPTLVVHIQYYFQNRREKLIVDTYLNIIQFTDRHGSISKYHFSDIQGIKFYQAYVRSSGWHSFGNYRYLKLIFSGGNEIIVTCLMVNDIEHTLSKYFDIPLKEIFLIFPLIYHEK